MKRRAKDLATDSALRARVLAAYTDSHQAQVVKGSGTAADPVVVHVIEIRRPAFWHRPWFAMLFTALGAALGGYLLQLS